jgi:hypothetical protein
MRIAIVLAALLMGFAGAIHSHADAQSRATTPGQKLGSDEPAGASFPRLRPQSIGTGNPEWKIRIDTTGVWRVSYQQLAVHGWPAGVAIDAVTAFRRDTTVNLQPEPWMITEISIDAIDANANSEFDTGDFLVLPVQNWADRVNPTWYERRYGDYDVVWLSYLSADMGLRVGSAPGWLDAVEPEQPVHFPHQQRYERNFWYLQFPQNVTQVDQFHWVDGFIDDTDTPVDTLFADLMDLAVSGPDISITAQWVGNTRTLHRVSASWVSGAGETPLWVDETFSSQSVQTLSTTMSAAAASPGADNRLRISGTNSSSVPGSGAPFNWFEVVYPRRYMARNNHLFFNSGDANGTLEYLVSGFASASKPEVYTYDVTEWGAPVRLEIDPSQVESDGGGWRARIQSEVTAGTRRHYFAATEVPSVPDDAISSEEPSSLYLTARGQAEFLLITYDEFAAAAEPLADFRRSQGITTLLVKAQDLYDEFNGGRKSHFAIRRFLRYALENWDSRFVLLVGDASEDAQGWLGTSDVDYMPTPIIQGPIPVSAGFEAVPSDNWYVTRLRGPPGPIEDLLVDMIIGRWTAGSVSEVQGLVAKSIAYESPPLDQPWRSRAVLIADDEFSSVSTFGGGGFGFEYCRRTEEGRFTTISQNLETIIKQDGGFPDYDVRPFYLLDLLGGLPTFPGQTCPTSRDLAATLNIVDAQVSPQLFSLLSEGAAFVNYHGHGNPFQLTHEELYMSFGPNQDLDFIFNRDKPWIFTCFAAHVNKYAGIHEGGFFGDGMGERLVNAPAKGAIASFASTAFELLPGNPASHLNLHIYRAFFVDPPPEGSSGRRGSRVVIGEALALGVARMVASTFGLEQRAALTYVLIGDPLAALEIKEQPQNQPPDCSQAEATVTKLWPPNHEFVETSIVGVTDPDGDAVEISIMGVTSDEPSDGPGQAPGGADAIVVGSTVYLRAERAGSGNGRVYRIRFGAADDRGGSCIDSVTVCVPHDRGADSVCIDDGAEFDVTACNAPRPADFWRQQFANDSSDPARISSELRVRIADYVSTHSACFEWSEGKATEQLRVVLNAGPQATFRQRGELELAVLLANLAGGALERPGSSGARVSLSPSTHISFPGVALDVGTLAGELDVILSRLEVTGRLDPEDSGRLETLVSCAAAVNRGEGLTGDSGCRQSVPPHRVGDREMIRAVGPDQEVSAPRELQLYRATPNPFRARTRIAYQVADPNPSQVDIGIYDVAGRKVIQLVDGIANPGRYQVSWDGANESGVRTAPGIYFLRVRISGELVAVTRILHLR